MPTFFIYRHLLSIAFQKIGTSRTSSPTNGNFDATWKTKYSELAQLAEHLTVNQVVAGSSPAFGANKKDQTLCLVFFVAPVVMAKTCSALADCCDGRSPSPFRGFEPSHSNRNACSNQSFFERCGSTLWCRSSRMVD